MTSRHNERLQERRQALREQHKRELEEAKRRQAAQLTSITAYDQRMAKLDDARRDVAAAVAEAVAAFGGRRDAAAALGLTSAEVRDYLNTHAEHAAPAQATEREPAGRAAVPEQRTAEERSVPADEPWASAEHTPAERATRAPADPAGEPVPVSAPTPDAPTAESA
ncbi:hypothetical protein [Streptomyces sp. WMMB303]|uniref:hypothetical protein n=1 Tax=Streptomyces sp. WMMB303 TaxID=3034154 RepID=UPI0023EB7324|nr:hypothetical protein [Streptomyces sp. WMMB303]MDF4254556.1 hypothetical protein [Streptomyces sp. WMMB303]